MNPKGLRRMRDSEGKGLLGCALFIVIAGVMIFLAIKLGPIYYTNYNLETEVRTEVSRAGARFLNDETVTRDILDIARKNEIRLTSQNIKIDRFAGQIHIDVNYAVPVDFVFFEHNVSFSIKVSSFIGTL
jgi:hypothetical protein